MRERCSAACLRLDRWGCCSLFTAPVRATAERLAWSHAPAAKAGAFLRREVAKCEVIAVPEQVGLFGVAG
jgi:hypothetical protein